MATKQLGKIIKEKLSQKLQCPINEITCHWVSRKNELMIQWCPKIEGFMDPEKFRIGGYFKYNHFEYFYNNNTKPAVWLHIENQNYFKNPISPERKNEIFKKLQKLNSKYIESKHGQQGIQLKINEDIGKLNESDLEELVDQIAREFKQLKKDFEYVV